MKLHQITPEFVDEIPQDIEHGKFYVCCRYRAVKHLCPCGCGVAVNIPLHPTGWTLICDGVSVSLWPSIGNWSESCQSHYWIRKNKIEWAPKWSRSKIRRERKARALELDQYFGANAALGVDQSGRQEFLSTTSLIGRLMRRFNALLSGK